MSGRTLMVVAAAIAVLLGAAWRAASRPLVTDEVEFVQTSRSLVETGRPAACDGPERRVIVHHPQGYHLLLGATLSALGAISPALAARLPGLLSLLVSLPLTFILARRLTPDRDQRSGWAAVLLLLAAPLAVQGSLVVDIDNTVLTPAVLGFLLLLMARAEKERGSLLWVASAGACFALLLWLKLPTPALAIAALGVVGLLTAGRRRLAAEALAAAVLGGLLFALTWWAFCNALALDPMAPLDHLAGRGADRVSLTLPVLGKRLLQLTVWLGPWLPAGALLAAPRVWRGRRFEHHGGPVVLTYAGLVVVGYLVVGGEAFGFTRYHVPVVPVLAAVAGTAVGRWPDAARRVTVVATVVVAAPLVAAGDPLLPWYTLREAVAAGDLCPADATTRLLLSSLVWLSPLVIVVMARRWGVAAGQALAAVAVVSGLVVSLHQLRADYSTNYLYGERGQRAASRRLASLAGGPGLVIVPKDLAFAALPCGSYRFVSRSLSRGHVRPALVEDELRLLVIRRGHLADPSVAPELYDPWVEETLAERFQRTRIGDFVFYERALAR